MAISKGQGITAASLIATIPIVWGGTEVLDSRYATASEVKDLAIDIYYGQFFDRLDDLDESRAEGNDKLVAVYERQLHRLLAKICAAEPTFEYCESGVPEGDHE